MDKDTKLNWPDLSIDRRAMELAKTAVGWDSMTPEQQTEATHYLLKLAQEFKEGLK